MMIVLLLLTPGCWSRKEINDLAVILAVGLDQEPQSNQLRLTLQIAKPKSLTAGTKQAGFGPGQKPTWIISGTGDTIFEATRNLATESSRDLYWGHTILLVMGDRLARDGVNQVLDFFARAQQPREIMWIMVTRGKAEDILRSHAELESTPAQRIGFLIRSKTGLTVNLKDFVTMMTKTGINPAAPEVGLATVGLSELKKLPGPDNDEKGDQGNRKNEMPPQAKLTGTALFREAKLVGWLDRKETRGLLWLKGEATKGIITIPCPNHPKEKLSVDIMRGSTEITPSIARGKPVFTIKIKMEGDLKEVHCPLPLGEPATIHHLEKEFARDMEERVRGTFYKIQKQYAVDVIGLGNHFYRRYPQEWKILAPRWEKVFPEVGVEFQVQTSIIHSGFLTEPLEPWK